MLQNNSGRSLVLVVFALAAACNRDDSPADAAQAEPPSQPRRTGAEAHDLRIMLAEIAASRGCKQFRDTFRPIADDEKKAFTGVTFIEECEAFADGTKVTLQLAGRGWRWVSKSSEVAGAGFNVDTYVRFEFSVELTGSIDAAYDTDGKVFTLWFTPRGKPKTTFEAIGDVEVDEEGMWPSVVGGIASMIGSSPEERAADKVSGQGRQGFAEQFARGIAVTIDLCSGDVRSGLGHPERGEMIGPRRAVHRAGAILHPGGLHIHGPVLRPPDGFDFDVPANVAATVACLRDAKLAAKAFLEGAPLPTIAAAGKDASCPLVYVVRAGERAATPASLSYRVTEVGTRLRPLARCKGSAR